MSIPTDRYYDKIVFKKDGIVSEILKAKTNSEYGSVLSRFHLDKILVFSEHINNNNNSSFIGAVEINSKNYDLHKAEHRSNVRLFQNNKNYVLLKDAGLNTLSYSEHISGREVIFANFISINFRVDSAYFSSTNEIGVQYRVGNGPWHYHLTNYLVEKGLSEDLTAEFSAYEEKTDVMPNVNYRIITINSQGTHLSLDRTVTPADIILNINYKRYNSPSDESYINSNLFIPKGDLDRALGVLNLNYAQATGVFAYETPNCINKVADGYYDGLTNNLVEIKSGELKRLFKKVIPDIGIMLAMDYEYSEDIRMRHVVVSMYYMNNSYSNKDTTLTYSIALFDNYGNQCEPSILFQNGAEGSMPSQKSVTITPGGYFSDYTNLWIGYKMTLEGYSLGFKNVTISSGKVNYDYQLPIDSMPDEFKLFRMMR